MANKDKLRKMLSSRSPLSQPERVIVQPESPYSVKPVEKIKEKITQPFGTTELSNRSDERSNRTVIQESSLIKELKEGVEEEKRPTERYSFEIFTDQKTKLEDLQYQYKRKTGKKLSASRILREALEEYLRKAVEALKE